jgi:hydrogenase small subunit
MRWNSGTSWPIEAGHPCLGCSEPRFWDAGGFYEPLSVPTRLPADTLLVAGTAGALIGGAVATQARNRVRAEVANRQPVTVEELEQKQ